MADDEIFDQEAFIAEGREMRLKHLEDQAMFALKIAAESYGRFHSVHSRKRLDVADGFDESS